MTQIYYENPDMIYENPDFSSRIQKILTLTGCANINQLSKLAGLSAQTIHTAIHRNAVSQATASKLADAANCSLLWVMTGQGESNSQAPSTAKTEAQILEEAGYKLIPLYTASSIDITLDPIDHFIMPKGMRTPPKAVAVHIIDHSISPDYDAGDHIICYPVHPDVCHDNGIYLISTPTGVFITPLRITTGGWNYKSPDGEWTHTESIEHCFIIMYAVAKVK